MKKIICLVLTIGLLFGFSGTAFADLSYEDLPENLKDKNSALEGVFYWLK